MVVTEPAVSTILLGAHRLGLADGQKAFIYVDTNRSLNVTSQLQMNLAWVTPPTPPGELSSTRTVTSTTQDSHALWMAAQSMLIIKAQAVPLVNADINSDVYKVCCLPFFFSAEVA